MIEDYQRNHRTAAEAAQYAETIDGWQGMSMKRLPDGSYQLTLHWKDEDDRKPV